MRILVVNWQDITNPQAGGAEVHLHEVFSRIAAMGHDVTLYCSSYPCALHEQTIKGIRVIREGGRHLFNFRFPLAYLTRFKKERFDIVVDDMNKIPFFTPLFVREPIYGVTHHLFGRSIFLEVNVILASYVYLMEKLAVWLYKRRRILFIVGSPSTERELLEAGFRAADITLVNYAVDHSKHRQTGVPRSTTPLIGYFGRLKRYKSVDVLLRALVSVLREVPDLKLLIVGEGDDRARLEALTRSLKLEKAVEFTGFVSEEKKVELLQRMWFKVTTSSKEGWGLTVIEANACGTPVIASNVPGLRDAVKDNETGLLYTYGDANELAQKILLLIRDRALLNGLTKGALRWSRSFDWDVAAKKTLELLTSRFQKEKGPGVPSPSEQKLIA
jgi:glycosyltransferase involved in cell wall biosynthesis